jgi:hypothetical protein
MIKFAVIDSNNNVINVIVADSIQIAEQATTLTCIEVSTGTRVSPGDIWDGTKFVHFEPKVAEATDPVK